MMRAKKGESFLKRYQFILFLLLYGCIFMTAGNRWNLYSEPISHLILQAKILLGKEEVQAAGPEEEQPEKYVFRAAFGDGKTAEMLGIYLDELEYDETVEADLENGPLEPGNMDAWFEEAFAKGLIDDVPELAETGYVETDVDDPFWVDEPWEPAAPTWGTVEETYFDDALFLGDSRVVGLRDYGKMNGHGTFYAEEGLSIYKLLSKKIVSVPGQRAKISVEEALGQTQYAKIYIMVGINELDVGTTERFKEAYQETIERIRELQPNAKIIIQSIMMVSKRRSAKGDFVNNAKIQERNEAIKELADDVNVFYLNVNEAVTDDDGCLNVKYTGDGIHLKAQYVPVWTEYLKTHALIW